MTKYIAYLDAGHAKSTAGKRSPDGSLLEWEFNNDMQYRMKKRLEAHGITVFLTNPNPGTVKDIPLTTRCNLANNHWVKAGKPKALFNSIHANAYNEQDAQGRYINAWNNAGGVCTFTSKSCSANSTKAAKLVQKELAAVLKIRDRGVLKENFTVIAKTSMPAILVEHAFYTKKDECEMLKSSAWRDKMVEANVKGMCAYFGITYKAPSTSSTTTSNPPANNSATSFKIGELNKEVEVTADNLNVRSGRGSEFSKIGFLKKGKRITIWSIAKAKDGSLWGSFRYDPDNIGFVHMGYVKLV